VWFAPSGYRMQPEQKTLIPRLWGMEVPQVENGVGYNGALMG